jgi:hypothetical protein
MKGEKIWIRINVKSRIHAMVTNKQIGTIKVTLIYRYCRPRGSTKNRIIYILFSHAWKLLLKNGQHG